MSRTKESRDAVAHLKRILRLGRLRLRGPNGAKDEFPLAATAQNLRKLAKLIPFRRQSSPHEAERLSFLSLTSAADTHRGRLKRGFFNEICRDRTSWAVLARLTFRPSDRLPRTALAPERALKIGPVNGREAQESGLWLKGVGCATAFVRATIGSLSTDFCLLEQRWVGPSIWC
jgi:hypothetical protein